MTTHHPLFYLMVALLTLSCEQPTQSPPPRIISEIIFRSELPPEFDTTRTFWYQTNVQPDSVLKALLASGWQVSQAWEPLDDMCGNPIGPHFTVELHRRDERITSLPVRSGAGFLLCATMLRHYRIVE